MEDKIKDIMRRRGALHVINEHNFYSEASVINCLQEAFDLLPQPYVIKSVCGHSEVDTCEGIIYCKSCKITLGGGM